MVDSQLLARWIWKEEDLMDGGVKAHGGSLVRIDCPSQVKSFKIHFSYYLQRLLQTSLLSLLSLFQSLLSIPKALPSSSSPSSSAKTRPSSRKHKPSKENDPPSDHNIIVPYSPSHGKLKSLFPPRPPSSNPLKRKLALDTVAGDNSLPVTSDSGVKVIVRMRPLRKDKDEGDPIVQKISGGRTFTFDSVADVEATQVSKIVPQVV
ncbi:kinesin-like protein KIN-12B [Vicia villosa]|uniref:kinesin-like protein KIN-12B n=1 Tax=Vicia villosa TaxID=3911 RepID=UPI00273B8E86|nr:kinesin-like protein KIN-12B [Vicia villosa]